MGILAIALIMSITCVSDEILNGELRMSERVLNWLSDRPNDRTPRR